MSDPRASLNEYLFYEFGLDGDPSEISDAWPFQLDELGATDGVRVYKFRNDQSYFALAGSSSLTFYPCAGMGFEDLRLQIAGAQWIGAQDPVDLMTSRMGEPDVPPTVERRNYFQTLASELLPARTAEVLEGLYLRKSGTYLGLLRDASMDEALVVGLTDIPIHVEFPAATPWRRLSWAVGSELSGNKGRGAG